MFVCCMLPPAWYRRCSFEYGAKSGFGFRLLELKDRLVGRDSTSFRFSDRSDLLVPGLTLLCISTVRKSAVFASYVDALEFRVGGGFDAVGLVACDTRSVMLLFGVFGGGAEAAVLLAFNVCGSEVPTSVALGEVDSFFPKFGYDGFGEEPRAGGGDVSGDRPVGVNDGEKDVRVRSALPCVGWVESPVRCLGEFYTCEGWLVRNFVHELLFGPVRTVVFLGCVEADEGDVADEDLRPGEVFRESCL